MLYYCALEALKSYTLKGGTDLSRGGKSPPRPPPPPPERNSDCCLLAGREPANTDLWLDNTFAIVLFVTVHHSESFSVKHTVCGWLMCTLIRAWA